MSEQSHKVNVNLNSGEKVVHVNLKQGFDFLKILTLELNSEDTYQLHTSNYGVVVGRVLANGSYGIPNVKVSAFIPLDNADKEDNVIRTEYPYSTMQVRNVDGKKYNILPDSAFGGYDGNYKAIGSFPNKRTVLDNNGQIEVFEKYWKYTTVTNEFGDYMLFGVPTGVTQIHIDCDISDIGILSQRPYDLIAKGYDATLFASMTEFKTDNLDNAPQIFTQNKTISVFPFWGDTDENRIGITRCDIELDYDFTPCCIFMGSIITDSADGYIGTNGMPNGSTGRFNALKTCTGNIEIIRRTLNGDVESLKENVDNIIDGNGVWCYQIPMNLDRVSMDEEGNLIQENNPNKGIPTRTRVRMRISLNDNGGVGTAKYLVPNNPKVYPGWSQADHGEPFIQEYEDREKDLEAQQHYYDFGKDTPDCCFRDLYWNKIYSIKCFYPRFQYGLSDPTQTGPTFQDVNDSDYANYFQDFSQIPINFSTPFSCIHSIVPSKLTNAFPYNTMYAGTENQATEQDNDDVQKWFQQHLSNESSSDFTEKGIHFSFENDWINGCLYFPNVLITNRDYFGKKNDTKDSYNRPGKYDKIYLSGRHNLIHDASNKTYSTVNYTNKWLGSAELDNQPIHGLRDFLLNEISKSFNVHIFRTSRFSQIQIASGLVTKKETQDGGHVYYYRYGSDVEWYKRLYATDIICLGNLIDVLDNLPHLFEKLPATTATFPPMSPPFDLSESGMNMNGSKRILDVQWGDEKDCDCVDIYGNFRADNNFRFDTTLYDKEETSKAFLMECKKSRGSLYPTGQDGDEESQTMDMQLAQERYTLFFGQKAYKTCNYLHYLTPTFANTSRICELGVGNDHTINGKAYDTALGACNIYPINGMIDRLDITDNEVRSEFASLNHNINRYKIDPQTRRKCFVATPLYMVDFDGRLSGYTETRKFFRIDEKPDKSYLKFRYKDDYRYHDNPGSSQYIGPMFYKKSVNYNDFEFSDADRIEHASERVEIMNEDMILPENSFYFYFGLNSGFSAIDKLYGKYYSPTK